MEIELLKECILQNCSCIKCGKNHCLILESEKNIKDFSSKLIWNCKQCQYKFNLSTSLKTKVNKKNMNN